ncbi:MAG: hypothetical protein ACO3JG_02280 [Luteolibacter sp.]
MSPDSIPQISLGTAALVIFVACAGFVMLRGMARMLAGTVVLALSAWIGFFVWSEAPAVSLKYLGKADAWLTNGLALAATLVSFALLRWIAKTVARPFGRKEEQTKSSGSLAVRLLLALIPTAVIWTIGAVLIHHTGSIAELAAHAEEKLGIDGPTPAKFSQRLKQSIDKALPESWLRLLDPLAEPARLELAKQITTRASEPRAAAIDPATGKPIPRAIIVEDPELQNLARKGKFGTLLRHPLLGQWLEKAAANTP